jgi:hypothetical protein
MTTREGHEMVSCTVVWQVDDPTAARRVLDDRFKPEADGAWLETHELSEDDSIIRAQLRLRDDRLTVITLSEERMDAVLDLLRLWIPGKLLSDERDPFGPDMEIPGPVPDEQFEDLDPEQLEEMISQFQEQMEDRWMREPVPALAGLTPRQAAAAPTRREQLDRLLASFEEMPPPEGGFTFRVDRLRLELGVQRD